MTEKITIALRLGYMELDDGWITPFNGYRYKIFPEKANTWEESQMICLNEGGDLIVHGFRDVSVRV